MLFLIFVLAATSNSEWIAQHSGLPPSSEKKPNTFSLNLTWQGDDDSAQQTVTLNLQRSEAIETDCQYINWIRKGSHIKPLFPI
ncbi:hypothetical protein EB796_012868 [Bugula neritina]|uniref:Uncharacterized protein n=1 Tax=Bugula neritina TaxID=10212 RepID=A0A7J7JR68_BUGNE|nr:hypothetical protein EB796_012868 [Bugula neritina]